MRLRGRYRYRTFVSFIFLRKNRRCTKNEGPISYIITKTGEEDMNNNGPTGSLSVGKSDSLQLSMYPHQIVKRQTHLGHYCLEFRDFVVKTGSLANDDE